MDGKHNTDVFHKLPETGEMVTCSRKCHLENLPFNGRDLKHDIQKIGYSLENFPCRHLWMLHSSLKFPPEKAQRFESERQRCIHVDLFYKICTDLICARI